MTCDVAPVDPSDAPAIREEIKARREEVLHLLERAASALIDAEEHGPSWAGYGAALERARAFKAQADRLAATFVPR